MIHSAWNDGNAVCHEKLLPVLPQQHRAAREMPSNFDSLELSVQKFHLFSLPQDLPRARSHDPLAVLGWQIYLTTECLSPIQRSRVVVRMGYHNGFNSAKFINRADGLVVDIRDTIPKHISLVCTAQNGALADCDLRLCIYTYYTRVVLVRFEHVLIFFGAL